MIKTPDAALITTSCVVRGKRYRLKITEGLAGQLYATSPDLRGLVIGRESIVEVIRAASQAIEDLLDAGALPLR